jgi:pyrophosphatase PpaX
MKEYQYYLFDLDGTILDTAELICACFMRTCRMFGNIELNRETIIRSIGLPLRAQLEMYLGPLSDERYESIRKEHMGYQIQISDAYLRLFPDTEKTLACLNKLGKKCAIVTSRLLETTAFYCEKLGIAHYFSVCITPENTQRHKPNPDPALAALSALNAPADQAVFIGDARFDIECAHAAGVDSCFVLWSNNDPESLPQKPTWLISGMYELCAFGL